MNAEKLFKPNFKGEILFRKEYIEHDGFDEYGPKSNLWTLFFIVKEDHEFILYEYYRSHYFYQQSKDDDEYELIKKEVLTKKSFNNDLRSGIKNIIIEDIESCNNEELKNYVKSI
jgi:hypothetical protein